MAIKPDNIHENKWRAAWGNLDKLWDQRNWFDAQWDAQRNQFRIVLQDGITVEYRTIEDMLGGNVNLPPEDDGLWLVCPECGTETPLDEEFCQNPECEHYFDIDN